jgi:hypothetical protein
VEGEIGPDTRMVVLPSTYPANVTEIEFSFALFNKLLPQDGMRVDPAL